MPPRAERFWLGETLVAAADFSRIAGVADTLAVEAAATTRVAEEKAPEVGVITTTMAVRLVVMPLAVVIMPLGMTRQQLPERPLPRVHQVFVTYVSTRDTCRATARGRGSAARAEESATKLTNLQLHREHSTRPPVDHR